MTPELTILTYAGLLWAAQFLAYLIAGAGKVDVWHALGPRDTPFDKPAIMGRLHRALTNHTEGLVLFAIAVLVVSVSGQSSEFTANCAWVYLIARVVYVPAYALGWTPWRTVIWLAGFGATVAMLLAALL